MDEVKIRPTELKEIVTHVGDTRVTEVYDFDGRLVKRTVEVGIVGVSAQAIKGL